MPDPYWLVKVIQLNTARDGTGDSAIILLADYNHDPPRVGSAVLVDGGLGTRNTELLVKTMKELENQFEFEDISGENAFKFNAVCMSHWDTDHWKGFCWQYTEDKPPYNFFYNDTYGFDDSDPEVKNVCKAFQYDSSNEPQTRFYCQRFNTKKNNAEAKASKNRSMNPDSKTKGYHRKINVTEIGSNKSATRKGVLDGYVDTPGILGVNLFNGKGVNDSSSITGLVELIKNNHPWQDETLPDDRKGAPGLYAFGVNQKFLGQDLSVFDEETPTPTNAGSIMLLLVWHDDTKLMTDVQKEDLTISFYTGGDAEYAAENALTDWLMEDWAGSGAAKNCYKINVIKAGHHGSSSATSTTFIEAVKPDHYILSAGFYDFHPRLETVWYMHAYFSANKASDPGLVRPRIHANCYPYWGGRVRLDTPDAQGNTVRWMRPSRSTTGLQFEIFDLNFVPKDKSGKPKDLTAMQKEWSDLRTKMSGYYGANASNKITQFSLDLKGDTTDDDKQSRLQEYMHDIWTDIASPSGSYYPLKTSLAAGAAIKPSLLKYIEVDISENGSEVAVSNVDEFNQELKRRNDKNGGVKRYKVSEAQAMDYEPSGAAPARIAGIKRTHQSIDDTEVRDPDVFTLTEKQEEDVWNSDNTGVVEFEDYTGIAPDDNVKSLAAERKNIGSFTSAGSPYFNQIVIGKVDASDNSLSVPDKSNLYYFLGGLHEQCMTFDYYPVPVDGKAWERKLGHGDEFAAWIANIFYFNPKDFDKTDSTTPVAVTSFSAWGHDTAGVTGFRATVSNFCGTTWNLTWSSEPALTQLILGASTYAERSKLQAAIDDSGIITANRTFIMGLDIRVPPSGQSTPTYRSNGNHNDAETFKLLDVLRLIAFLDPAQGTNAASMPLEFAEQLLNIQLDLDMPVVSDYKTTSDTGSSAVQALWFTPGNNYLTTLRVDFVEHNDILSNLLSKALGGSIISKVKVAAVRRTQFCFEPPFENQIPVLINDGELCFSTTIVLPGFSADSAWDAYVSFNSSSLTFLLRWPSSGNPLGLLEKLIAWVTAQKEMSGFAGSYATFNKTLGNWSGSQKIDEEILLREVLLVVDWSGGSPSLKIAKMTLELDLDWGVDHDAHKDGLVPFRLVFSYDKSGGRAIVDFDASIWPAPPDMTDTRLNPTSAPYPLLVSAIDQTGNAVYNLSLNHLGFDSKALSSLPIPKSFPTVVSAMELNIGTAGIYFLTTLATGGQPQSDSPSFSLDQVSFSANMSWDNTGRSIDLSLFTTSSLDPKIPGLEPALMHGGIDYQSSNGTSFWKLNGSIYKLSGAHIYCLFPNEDRNGVMNVMKEIWMPELNVEFTYGSGGEGTSFTADGLVLFGQVALGIDFQYNTPTLQAEHVVWQFTADFSWAADPENGFETHAQDLQSLISDFCPSISIPDRLDFLASVSLTVDPQAKFELKLSRTADKRYHLSLDASVGSAEFTYVQLSAEPNGDGSITNDPFRVLKCEIKALPTITGLPMLTQFEQPFDQMGFVWVNGDKSVNGLDRATVDLINSEVFANSPHSELVYRDPRKYTSDTSVIGSDLSKDTVILFGSHLVVVVEEGGVPTAVIDYCFNTQKPQSQNFEGAAKVTLPTTEGAILDYSVIAPPSSASTAANDQAGGASGVLQKSKGPLTISGLGLKYQAPELRITFDVAVDLGALKVTLKGFGVHFNLASFFDLNDVGLLIDGVGLEMNEPPVTLAGEVMKKVDSYLGGVDLSVEPYSFLGGGYYGNTQYEDKTVNPPVKTGFDTTFIFAELAGPFVELEFASLSGLTAGFGHNSHLTLPIIDNVTTFPFLESVTGNDPLSVLNNFLIPPASGTPWFGHDKNAEGETWMAAGFTAKAFHTLDVDTVMTVDISKTDISIGVFAHATATVPPEANKEDMFARVDMGLLAILDWSKGIFKVEGQLTPQSFILDQDCKLTGGFALCYFFDGSGHNGDWVLSIGGYHPSFIPPSWYPVPQKVGIRWILDSQITVSGQAYFAVTPKCAMGGGKLDLVFQAGNLKAWFDAYADFLVNYKPFSFTADLGLTIGIEYTLQVFCVTKRFGINFGCSLHIHGPPVAGYVHVGWSIISFDIHFGSANERTTPLTWLEFQDLIRQDGKIAASDAGAPTLLKASATRGIIDDPDAKPEDQIKTADDAASGGNPPKWHVNHSKFAFDLTSVFPLTAIDGKFDPSSHWSGTAADSFGGQHSINDVAMRPMQVQAPATSVLQLSITQAKSSIPIPFVLSQVIKQVPTAVWDIYTPTKDPLSTSFSSTAAFSSAVSTKPLCMGVSLSVPPPISTGPFIGLDLVNTVCFDCYANTKPQQPPVHLPDCPSDLKSIRDPLTPQYPSYHDIDGQEEQYKSVVQAWKKSASDDVMRAILATATVLGAKRVQAERIKAFASTSGPPMETINSINVAYVVPPLVNVGST